MGGRGHSVPLRHPHAEPPAAGGRAAQQGCLPAGRWDTGTPLGDTRTPPWGQQDLSWGSLGPLSGDTGCRPLSQVWGKAPLWQRHALGQWDGGGGLFWCPQLVPTVGLCQELRQQHRGDITTSIQPAGDFYYAEDHHQQYLHKVPGGYCGLKGTGVPCPTAP